MNNVISLTIKSDAVTGQAPLVVGCSITCSPAQLVVISVRIRVLEGVSSSSTLNIRIQSEFGLIRIMLIRECSKTFKRKYGKKRRSCGTRGMKH